MGLFTTLHRCGEFTKPLSHTTGAAQEGSRKGALPPFSPTRQPTIVTPAGAILLTFNIEVSVTLASVPFLRCSSYHASDSFSTTSFLANRVFLTKTAKSQFVSQNSDLSPAPGRP